MELVENDTPFKREAKEKLNAVFTIDHDFFVDFFSFYFWEGDCLILIGIKVLQVPKMDFTMFAVGSILDQTQ